MALFHQCLPFASSLNCAISDLNLSRKFELKNSIFVSNPFGETAQRRPQNVVLALPTSHKDSSSISSSSQVKAKVFIFIFFLFCLTFF